MSLPISIVSTFDNFCYIYVFYSKTKTKQTSLKKGFNVINFL